MEGRNFVGDTGLGYRFGFNGQEKTDDINGIGNSLEFEYRIYDSRLGRFLSVDPISNEYPWNSTYAFAENRVIDGGDLEGKEWESRHKWGDIITDKVHIIILTELNIYKEGMTYRNAWQKAAPIIMNDYVKKKVEADCADLCYTAIIDFAEIFELPIFFKGNRVENKDVSFDNDRMSYNEAKKGMEYTYSSKEELTEAVCKAFGAADLGADYGVPHTKEKEFDEIKPGDIVFWALKEGSPIHHAQTVTKVTTDISVGLGGWLPLPVPSLKIETEVTAVQGNIDKGKVMEADVRTYRFENLEGGIRPTGQNKYEKEKTTNSEWNFESFDKNK